MHLTKADLVAVERELCKRSLAHFARRAWHVLEPAAELKWGWALDAICLHLEAVTDGRITRLLMNVPPGSMKSLLTGVIWPAWEWGPKGLPWKRFVGTAHEEQLAIRDSRRCRDLVKSEWFQKLWPLELLQDLDGKREFGNVNKGVRQARSFTSMTGVRGDCLLAGSMVNTEDGIKDIKEIVDSAYTGNVLSYDHDTKQLVYRPVQAVARRSSKDFYRIHFADGGVVECTGDHRIYTDRGYVSASFLSEGDACLRVLPGACYQGCGRHEEAHKERLQLCKLFEAMQPDTHEYVSWEDGSALHGLRRQDSQEQPPMLASLQSTSLDAQRSTKQERHGDVLMPCLRDREAKEDTGAPAEVLFGGLQRRPSCSADARPEQSRVARWRQCQEIRQRYPESLQDGAGDRAKGRSEQVRSLRINEQTSLSPHRPRFNQQPTRKLSDALPNMPHEASWRGTVEVQKVAVRMVERVRESADVYDIQVSGTHCFFANGILVHNCVILDDPLSADNANSQAKLDAAKIAFTETLPTRVNSDKSAIVVIMQRLHEDDTSGVILKMGLPYVHLCIPMRFEPDRRCVTSIGWQDPRAEAGELMFPERFGEQQVRELEATLGTYGTAGQLQQRPSPRGGGMLKSSWLTYWHTVPLALDFRFVTADTAQKTSTQHDYSVLQCWGRSVAGKAVLLDQIRGKWEAPELITEARAFWLKHLHDGRPIMAKAPLRAMYVEDKVSGTGLIQTLRRESITVLPVQRTKDKQSRGYDAAPFIESGNVVVPQDAPWLSDFLSEFSTFPNGAHDDQLDPLFDAIDLAQKLPSVKSQSVTVLPTMSRW